LRKEREGSRSGRRVKGNVPATRSGEQIGLAPGNYSEL